MFERFHSHSEISWSNATSDVSLNIIRTLYRIKPYDSFCNQMHVEWFYITTFWGIFMVPDLTWPWLEWHWNIRDIISRIMISTMSSTIFNEKPKCLSLKSGSETSQKVSAQFSCFIKAILITPCKFIWEFAMNPFLYWIE